MNKYGHGCEGKGWLADVPRHAVSFPVSFAVSVTDRMRKSWLPNCPRWFWKGELLEEITKFGETSVPSASRPPNAGKGTLMNASATGSHWTPPHSVSGDVA